MQTQGVAAVLGGRRIAAVFSSDAPEASRTAESLAVRLGAAVTACPSLRADSAGSEPDAHVVSLYRDQLEAIADLHRGETVLVVGDLRALAGAAAGLAHNVTPVWTEHHALGNGETVELDADADGWLVRRWGSERLV